MSQINLTENNNQNEERLSLAIQGSNDGVWDWDLKSDYVYYSPRWKNMLGYNEIDGLEDHINTWKKLVHPDDKEKVLSKVAKYLENEIDSFDIEIRMIHKKGNIVHVLSRAFLVNSKNNDEPIRLVGTHIDITQRKKAEAHNKKTTEILKQIAVGLPANEVYNSIALMYEDLHPGLRCSMLELHGNKLMHGGAPSLPEEYCEAVNGLIYGPEVGSCGTSTYTGKRVIVENIETDAKWTDIKKYALPHGLRCCWSEPIKNSSGIVLGAFGMYFNYYATPNEEQSQDLESAARLAGIVMERDQTQRQIYKLAFMDELTGLPSRAKVYQQLEKTIELSNINSKQFGIMYIDLDDFKQINDSLGHDVGDQLLQKVSNRLKNAIRKVGFVGRLGGDEFCIIVNDLTKEKSEELAKICINEVSKTLELKSRVINPSISIGIAHYPQDGLDITSLFKAADVSLYRSKEKGKNQFTFYAPEFTKHAEYVFQLEQFLKIAIEKNQFTLAYQPIVNISSGQISGVEALLRWNHPELGIVEPVEFIATAERIGMIKPLTEWVLLNACKQLVLWEKEDIKGLSMAVNISPNHFLDKAIVPLIKNIIEETGINPGKLELEVTESVVQINDNNLSVFRDLKSLGIRLAIDDFGTRYSYFASLKHLQVDTLKIDKYFVDDIVTEDKSLVLYKSMVEMGHNLGYEITVEGVESQEQFDVINKLGCKSAQGFLFSKPLSPDKITQLLNN